MLRCPPIFIPIYLDMQLIAYRLTGKTTANPFYNAMLFGYSSCTSFGCLSCRQGIMFAKVTGLLIYPQRSYICCRIIRQYRVPHCI